MTGPTADNQLLFVPLGGAGEIGMNLNLFQYKGRWLMVDLGITFGDDTTPGIDVIMPDPAFIVSERDRLDGLVLTHAHEDHIGAVQYLWPKLRCPVYTTPFTASVLRRKLQEAGLADAVEITEVPLEGRFSVGPFDIELITLTHSIPEPNALVIRTEHGAILHTGDWKFDPEPLVGEPADEAALRALGEEGVLAYVGDSTNVFREGTAGSEADVRRSLIEMVGQYDGRVAIACFASNVARLETVAKVAEATGRSAALVGRSLWRIYEAAQENGLLTEIPRFLDGQEAAQLPADKVLLACTGSQGEPRAALSRIAAGDHPDVGLGKGDVVIFSSRIIPGNEIRIGRLHSALVHRGVEVVTERDGFVHVSGHPARDELIQMLQWTRPHVAVPVHGEFRHLVEHRRLAAHCQVPESVLAVNGDVVRLAPGPAEVVGDVQVGRLALDGTELVPMDAPAIRERKRMSFNGSAVATLVMNGAGDVLCPPQISVQGVLDRDDDEDVLAELREAVQGAVENLSKAKRRDDGTVRETARVAVRRYLRATRGKKPPTEVHLVRLD